MRNGVTIEVKAISELLEREFAQALNTLSRLNIKEGLLINFGATSLEYKHLFNKTYELNKVVEDITPELVGEPNDHLWHLRDYVPSWVIHKMQLDKQKKT